MRRVVKQYDITLIAIPFHLDRRTIPSPLLQQRAQAYLTLRFKELFTISIAEEDEAIVRVDEDSIDRLNNTSDFELSLPHYPRKPPPSAQNSHIAWVLHRRHLNEMSAYRQLMGYSPNRWKNEIDAYKQLKNEEWFKL